MSNIFKVGRCLIPDLRKKHHLTQEKLSELTGISRSKIAQYETLHNIPNLENAKTIATALKCKIDDLFEWRVRE